MTTQALQTKLEKQLAKVKATKRLLAQQAKAQKAKEAEAAAALELRKDTLILAMLKATKSQEIVEMMDAYLTQPADRELFGL
jgi:hypothetical protein